MNIIPIFIMVLSFVYFALLLISALALENLELVLALGFIGLQVRLMILNETIQQGLLALIRVNKNENP